MRFLPVTGRVADRGWLATFRERCYVITVITVEVGPQEEIDKGKSLTKKPAKSEPRQTFDNEPVAVSKWHDILW